MKEEIIKKSDMPPSKEPILMNHPNFGSFNVNETTSVPTYSYNQDDDIDKAFRVEDINKNKTPKFNEEESFYKIMT